MTLEYCIETVDKLLKNNIDKYQKSKWIEELENRIVEELLSKYYPIVTRSLNYDVDKQTKLIISAPFDRLYIFYLICQIYLYNDDINRYNNHINLFNDEYMAFESHVVREGEYREGNKLIY